MQTLYKINDAKIYFYRKMGHCIYFFPNCASVYLFPKKKYSPLSAWDVLLRRQNII